jgi:hypothetical protein
MGEDSMKILLLLASVAATYAPLSAHASSYDDGRAAWSEFKQAEAEAQLNVGTTWMDGWRYWIGQRSTPGHRSCRDASMGDGTFYNGCFSAYILMGPIDQRRLSDPVFRAGFNDAAKEPLPAPDALVPAAAPPRAAPVTSPLRATDDPKRPVDDVCKESEGNAAKFIRREISAPAFVEVAATYGGGRYLGRSAYKCAYRATLNGSVSENDITVSVASTKIYTFRVEVLDTAAIADTYRVIMTDLHDRSLD